MASLEIKTAAGKAGGKVELGVKLTEATASHTSIHRAVVAEEANKRQGTQSAKTRSETRGGGRKPYKQKKTGNARQGSTRSPHYAHGSMALAVKPRDYEKKINKRERRAAILTAFASHVAAGNVTVAEKLLFTEPKTSEATKLIEAVGLKDARKILVILENYDEATFKSFRNIANVTVRTAPSSSAKGAEAAKTQAFSTRDLLVATNILVAKDALAKIEEVWAK
jgi:large subunit ribosomal protein L4